MLVAVMVSDMVLDRRQLPVAGGCQWLMPVHAGAGRDAGGDAGGDAG